MKECEDVIARAVGLARNIRNLFRAVAEVDPEPMVTFARDRVVIVGISQDRAVIARFVVYPPFFTDYSFGGEKPHRVSFPAEELISWLPARNVDAELLCTKDGFSLKIYSGTAVIERRIPTYGEKELPGPVDFKEAASVTIPVGELAESLRLMSKVAEFVDVDMTGSTLLITAGPQARFEVANEVEKAVDEGARSKFSIALLGPLFDRLKNVVSSAKLTLMREGPMRVHVEEPSVHAEYYIAPVLVEEE